MPARIDGFALHFSERSTDEPGNANVEPLASSSVWGVLYEIRDDDLIKLDQGEGERLPSANCFVFVSPVEVRSIYCARVPARRNCITESGPVVWYRAVTFPTRFPSRNVTATRFDTCIPFRTALANGPAS